MSYKPLPTSDSPLPKYSPSSVEYDSESLPKPPTSRAKKLIAIAFVSMLALASIRPLYRTCASRGMSSAVRIAPNSVSYTLPSGDKIPSVALGTWKAGTGEVQSAVSAALKEVRLPPLVFPIRFV